MDYMPELIRKYYRTNAIIVTKCKTLVYNVHYLYCKIPSKFRLKPHKLNIGYIFFLGAFFLSYNAYQSILNFEFEAYIFKTK